MALQNVQVRVNAYRFAGRGRDEFAGKALDAARKGVVVESDGNFYSLKEAGNKGNCTLGRVRRLQEKDVPPIGTRTGEDEPLEGKGLSHRAYFLIDQDAHMLLWLASHHSCGPMWITKIVRELGCSISLAIHLDTRAYQQVLAGKDAITRVRVAVATSATSDLGFPITDDLITRAHDLEADIVEMTLKVSHERDSQRTLGKTAWRLIERLYERHFARSTPVKALKVEMFDEQSGEFVAKDLLKERSHVDLDSPFTVQQLPPKVAYQLLADARRELLGSPP